ncbi:clathrin light chain [Piedraia hortae CBS 480.64]|uniref:Clathrin light chain n=1 Tax=Piedraia hortae CBS 480.64 TaxID=1314780 RepID=A0A6A7BYS7_9PEZI|nr:clathrin light chain [Piedraia hortae CBS 480.64]
MADRFPSLDEFDAGQTEPAESTSDFLARERALLGDEAQQFASSDADLLGGEDEPTAPPSKAIDNSNIEVKEDAEDDMMGDFESSFPSLDNPPAGASTSAQTHSMTLPYHSDSRGISGPTTPEEEPKVITDWRNAREESIAKRDKVSEAKKEQTVKAAHEAIDEFYENYNNRKDKQIAQTRKEAEEFLNKREDTASGGTSWERIAKLIDLSGKGSGGGAPGTGKAKMREMLIALKKDTDAPGASGV